MSASRSSASSRRTSAARQDVHRAGVHHDRSHDNQITRVPPRRDELFQKNKVADAKNVKIGMVSPDGRDGMMQAVREFKKAGIPFIFDPGQGLPMFNGDDLRKFIEQATWVTVNDYEWELLKDRTGWTEKDITSRVDALIITLGGKGSEIHTKEQSITIPAATPKSVQDPTGCGDAYRAGLLYGLLNKLDWETTGRSRASWARSRSSTRARRITHSRLNSSRNVTRPHSAGKCCKAIGD